MPLWPLPGWCLGLGWVFWGCSATHKRVGSYIFCSFATLAMATFAVALFSGAGSRPAATRFLLSCQKKPGKENARLAGGLSARTHFATTSLRSNRLSEIRFLIGSVRVRRYAAARTQERASQDWSIEKHTLPQKEIFFDRYSTSFTSLEIFTPQQCSDIRQTLGVPFPIG